MQLQLAKRSVVARRFLCRLRTAANPTFSCLYGLGQSHTKARRNGVAYLHILLGPRSLKLKPIGERLQPRGLTDSE